MGGKVFSKREAFSHGYKMTKKYVGVILRIVIISAVFQIINIMLQQGAGFSFISKESVYRNFKDAGNFYRHLQETGCIDKYGNVQEKLKNIKNAQDLTLPVNLEADRDKVFRFLNKYRYRLPFSKGIFYLLTIGLWVVAIIMNIGWVKITLLCSRDQKPNVSELFSNGGLFFSFILASICYTLAIIGGFILLIIPGIILIIMLSMYQYFIIDKNMGPLASLKASYALTKGARWQLSWFMVLALLINLGGVLCFLVGLLFTIPLTSIATAYVYDQLRRQEETAIA
ncbi:MAG: hypothetical protein NC923_01300 [Candidatus Omnitrophica bacterium]|nr:hypothetical protein [Candidatus Omnitrophota bacterium]